MQKPPYILICGKKSPKKWHGRMLRIGDLYGELRPEMYFTSNSKKENRRYDTYVFVNNEWQKYLAPINGELGMLIQSAIGKKRKTGFKSPKPIRIKNFKVESKTTHKIDCVYAHIHIYKK